MLSSSRGPRTTMVTRLACRARLSAACPAEFAAPTTCTSSPWHCTASLATAPGELLDAGRRQATVRDAGRDDQRAGLDLAGPLEQHRADRAAGLEADDV